MKRAALLVIVLLLASSAGTLASPDDARISRDVVGWEDGYWYDDPVSVTVEDGLNASERAAVTARAKARIEYLRGKEFRETVSVQVISRAEYLATRSGDRNETHSQWNNQVWKATFLVGDDRDVGDVFEGTLGSSIVGYYRIGTGEIVVVSDSATPALSRGTLVHELVHALQDQHFGLSARPDTQDAQLARNGVVEGEANRLQRLYEQRCAGTWSCVDTAGSAGSGGGGDEPDEPDAFDRDVFLVIYHPYVVGPEFVDRVAERGGADALDGLYEDFPPSTEQLIHPGAFPDERPVDVTVPDRSTGDWRRFDHEPVADTVGEATIYAMVVANDLGEVTTGRYGYRHPISEGWAGDSVVPYRNGDRFGYVWETAWDSPADAREFHEGYRELLDDRGAEVLDDGRYRIPSSDPFGGVYRVTREGATVRIVHGPTLPALSAIHGP